METVLIENRNTYELQRAKGIIGQFINSCSHTMRGPLKSIEGLVNILNKSDSCSRSDAELLLNLISNTVLKMERTLDELEHFLENSTREVTSKPLDFTNVMSHALDHHMDEINEANIRINLFNDQSVPFYSDLGRMRLIITNLLANAIQFRDPNKEEHEIGISFKTTSTDGTITISDNGIGIDPEEQSQIFQLFYRATEKSSGTGVGLYVVREAVEKMGGSIVVDSVPGRGSAFTITIPNLIQ